MAHVLDADQLKTFVAIVESGSFTRAADMVRKTQSAVSMQMKRLEERVGRQLFARDGRQARLTEDGERLLDYARRIVRLNLECVSSFAEADLKGRVSLGVPDDYADRYLPEILARFARSNPKTEVTVICEPTPLLAARIETGDLDLAVVTHVENRKGSEIIRLEPLLWVTSARHDVHADDPIPLALGCSSCNWRMAAVEGLEKQGKTFRVLYSSWNSSAVGAAVLAGLALSVLPESAVRPGMRILGAQDGFPPLPVVRIGLMKNRLEPSVLTEALAGHITQSLDNLTSLKAIAAE